MYNNNKIFLKPNIEPLDSNTQRIRRNIIITSIVTFFFTIGSNGIDLSASSFLGIRFLDLNSEYLKILTLVSMIYFIIHFIWATWDHFRENCLRLTALAVIKTNINAPSYPSNGDLDPNVEDSNQSSIFSWWIGRISRNDDSQESLDHDYEFISDALGKFEKGFLVYQKSQLYRWYLLDTGIPICLGMVSSIALIKSIFFSC